MTATFGIVHPKIVETPVAEEVERLQNELQQISYQLDRLEVEFSRFVHKASHGFLEGQH